MSALSALWLRDQQRQGRSGLSHVGVFLFYIAHGAYFAIVLSSLSGDQPQPISPLRWLLGGDLLMTLPLILPAFLVKAFAEERQNQTLEPLLCSGVSSWSLLMGKFFALISLWLKALLSLLPLLVIISIWGRVGMGELFLAWVAYGCVGSHWLALGCAVSCKSLSVVSAFSKTAVALLLYWSIPFLSMIWRDPFYRIVFETFEFRSFLNRSSQGRVLLSDLIFVVGGGCFWIWVALARLELERHRQAWLRTLAYHFGGGCLIVAMLYLGLFISHRRPRQWDVSSGADGSLSEAYQTQAQSFPEGLKITVALPKRLSIATFETGRDLILNFLEQSLSWMPKAQLRVIDPDVDLLEMEQLQRSGLNSKSKIGFVLMELSGRRVVMSYHQWLSLGVMTLDNEPRRYVEQFHGEALMVRAVNNLTRSQRDSRVLILTGQGELDVLDEGRLGGSALLETLQHLGWKADIMRVGIDEIDLDHYQLILSLDPTVKPPKAFDELCAEALTRRLPILATMGALGSLASTRAFEPFGIEVEPAVIVQRRFGAFDPLSLPVYEFNMDEALSPLRGKMLLMDRCRPLLMGIASDPRLVPVPLARSEQHAQVWGEASWNPEEPNVRHAFDAQDLASPLVVSMGVKALDASGERPVLVALGSRAPLENRFIYEAGNRHLVLHAIKWLTGSGDAVGLPPRSPLDHRFRLPLGRLMPMQLFVLLFVPMLLMLSWWWRCRRWR